MIASEIGFPEPVLGGWMTGFALALIGNDNVDIHVSFPVSSNQNFTGKVNNISYSSFRTSRFYGLVNKSPSQLAKSIMSRDILDILKRVKPDVLHIFGTEFAHSYVFARLFDNPERTVINIQGLTSIYAKHYLGALSWKTVHKITFGSILRGTLHTQMRNLTKRGKLEIDTLKLVDNVIGRTDWDRATATVINSVKNYFFCNEILRDSFYGREWTYELCDKETIFFGQSSSPIKGFYMLIEALPLVKKRFPNVKVYVAGNNPLNKKGFKGLFLTTSYASYIRGRIKKLDLSRNIEFVGNLSENEMATRMIKSHCAVSASTIENESNFISEAMLMGVPVISSFVGGVTSRLEHRKNALIYQWDASYMLASYIIEIFSDSELCKKISWNQRTISRELFDKRKNINNLLSIYKTIGNE
jgi:glycosyltransferase involved in cell wall biosynthesis